MKLYVALANMAAPGENTLAFIEYLCLFFGISGALLLKVDQIQPKPYMDEIFHVPQAQRYCEGRFREVILKNFHVCDGKVH